MKRNELITNYTLEELRNLFVENSLPKFSADQVYDWIYRKLSFNLDEWSNVSKKVKAFLSDNLNLYVPEIAHSSISSDGTTKFLLEMEDNETVESVIIQFKNRLSLCVSTQVGCAMGCIFCNTASQKFTRNLEAGEIVGQYLAAATWLKNSRQEEERLGNIVFMGQGEPLNNFENSKKAIQIFMEVKGIGIGQRKITLSTVGIVPQIEKLNEFPPVNIAISLHAATDEIRNKLIPINKKHNIEELLNAIKKIPLKAYRRITYEYLLIENLNDRMEDIEILTSLLDRELSKINLIPFNEYPNSKFKRPSDEKISWFMDGLIQRGFTCTVRVTKGSDILAACGQLKSKVQEKK